MLADHFDFLLFKWLYGPFKFIFEQDLIFDILFPADKTLIYLDREQIRSNGITLDEIVHFIRNWNDGKFGLCAALSSIFRDFNTEIHVRHIEFIVTFKKKFVIFNQISHDLTNR